MRLGLARLLPPVFLLLATPAQAGKAIFRAVSTGKDEAYVPFFWRYIMLIIRNIPRRVFKKMSM